MKQKNFLKRCLSFLLAITLALGNIPEIVLASETELVTEAMTETAPVKEAEAEQPVVISDSQEIELSTTEKQETEQKTVETSNVAKEAEVVNSPDTEAQETEYKETKNLETEGTVENTDPTEAETATEAEISSETNTDAVAETEVFTETELSSEINLETEMTSETEFESESEIEGLVTVYGIVGHDTDTLRPYKSFETKKWSSVKDFLPETITVFTNKEKTETMELSVSWETEAENDSFYLNIYSLVLPKYASWCDSLLKQFEKDSDYTPYVQVSIKRSYKLKDEVAEFKANTNFDIFNFIRLLSCIDEDHFMEVLYNFDDWNQFSENWHYLFSCMTREKQYAFYTIVKEEYIKAVIDLKSKAGSLSKEELTENFNKLLLTLDVCMLALGYNSDMTGVDVDAAKEKAYDYLVRNLPEDVNVNSFKTYHNYLQKNTAIDIDKLLIFFASVENNRDDETALIKILKDNHAYMEEAFGISHEEESELITDDPVLSESEPESDIYTEDQTDSVSSMSYIKDSNDDFTVTVTNADGSSFGAGTTLELLSVFDLNEDYSEALKKESSLKNAWKQILLDVYYETEEEKESHQDQILKGVKEFFPYLIRISDYNGEELSFNDINIEIVISDADFIKQTNKSESWLAMALHQEDDSIDLERQPETSIQIGENSITMSFKTDSLGWLSVIASEFPPEEVECGCGLGSGEAEAFIHAFDCPLFIKKMLEYCDCGSDSTNIAEHKLDCLATVFINEATCTCSDFGEFDGGATPLSYHDPKCESYVRMLDWLCDCGSDAKEIDLHDDSCAAYQYLYAMDKWVDGSENISTFSLTENITTLSYGSVGSEYSGCIDLPTLNSSSAYGYNHYFTATISGKKRYFFGWDNTTFTSSDYILAKKGANFEGKQYDVRIYVKTNGKGYKCALINDNWYMSSFGHVHDNSSEGKWGWGKSYSGCIEYTDCSGGHGTTGQNGTKTSLRFRFYEPDTTNEVSFNGLLYFDDLDPDTAHDDITAGEMFRVTNGEHKYYKASDTTYITTKTVSSTEWIVSTKAKNDDTNDFYVAFKSTPSTPFTFTWNTGRYFVCGISSNPINITYKTTKDGNTSTKTVKVAKYCDYKLISPTTYAGYTFSGWYTNSSYTTNANEGYKATGAKTFYGKYTPTIYTNSIVHWKYVGTGGDNSDGTMKKMTTTTFPGTYNTTVTIPSDHVQSYSGYYNDGRANSKWGTSSWSVKSIGSSFTQPAAAVQIEYYYYPTPYVDLNGYLDGVSSGNISGYGTADVYIGEVIKGNDVEDFYQQHEYGQSYEVNDIKATTGHTYNGVYSGSLSGTIGVNKVSISLNFTTNYVHVAYNANGGTLSSSAYSLNNNKFVLDSSGNAWFHDIKYGETKDPYNAATFGLTKTGYTFSGWEVQSSSGVILDQDTAYESIKYTKAGDSTKTTANESGFSCNLLAKWKPNTYTVVYNGNGATKGSTDSSTHTYDVAKNLTANGFSKEGYTFLGWAISENGDVVYNDQESVKNLASTNGATITLYAVWKLRDISYTIQYNGNGATAGATEASTHKYGVAKKLTANGFTKTGHTFSGWSTSANGTVAYADQESVLNLTSTDGATIDLYAVWSVNKYLFDIKGYLDGNHSDTVEGYGTVDIYIDNALIADDVSDYSEDIPYGSSYEITDIKEATGHTYNGVYSGSISGTIDATDNITSLDFTTNKYKIVFDGNGATSGSMKDSTFTYGVKGNLPKNKYVKDDYNFNKWNTKADGSGTFYSDEEEILNLTSADGEVITLYAQWISACAYIDGVNGNDSNDGKTPETPIKTFAQAYKNLPRGGIIYVVNQVTIKKNMTLGQSSYSDSSETISLGNHTVMVKRYSRPTAYQRLSGFNVASYTGAMILVPSGYTLTLNDVTIDGHRYAKNSGAANEIAPSVSAQSPVICLNSGSLSMNGGTITNNKNTASSSKGGGVYSSSSAAVSITAGTITENYAYYGGGIYSYGKLSISNGTISSNVANYGGGIYSHGTISMAGGIISSNSALTNGGGILNASGSTALITGGTIEDNEASTYGGGILNTGTLSMSNGTITGNSAPNGGGIRNSSNGSVTINGGLITGNSASSNGGAIHNQSSGSLNITGGTIQGNSATLNGSAVYQDGNMYMKKAASISIDNDVYLPVNRYITVDGSLTTEDTVAKITPHKYENGRTVVRTAYPEGKETLASEVYGLFMLTENPDNEDTLLRPGDFVDDSINIKNTDVIISEAYNLSYTSSFNCVTDLPKTQVGYWNEHTIVSDQVPVKPGYKFLLWSIEKDMIDEIGNETGSESESGSETETGTENTIIKEYAPESIILLTEDTILYAVWEINMGIELFIEDEKFYVNKEVTEDDIRRTLQVKVTDLETNERIEDYLGGYDAVLEMVKIKEILDTSNQVFELVDYLYTGIEEIYRVTYELEIIPEYITSPGREDSPSVVGTVLQKVEIIDEYPDLSDQSDPLCDIRFISADYLSSLDSNSKWRTNAELHSKLVASVNKEATDANAVYVIEMTKEQCDSIKAYIFNGKTWDNDLNKDVISAYGGVLSKRP